MGVRWGRGWAYRRCCSTSNVGVPVNGYASDVAEQSGGSIPAFGEMEEFGRLVDKTCCIVARPEPWVVDKVFDKYEVGGNPTNTKLSKCPIHAGYRLRCRRRPGRDFFQQAVIETRNNSARVSGATV